ncbi:TetR/AcrR family transcriptional regulator [Paenibacillus apiarius]|uniref:TetR/AcrR family transcriptional regulator n=1 Tax=Paenibacillus apiarius TaxID=46240 RepID=UPI001F0953BA|nr:TetR/AcrR family transcriptional regulator [Paenibacillus apiarius]
MFVLTIRSVKSFDNKKVKYYCDHHHHGPLAGLPPEANDQIRSVASEKILKAARVDIRIEELLVVMEAAAANETPAEQIRHIVEGSLDNVRIQPEVFRFYLHLMTQPKQDKVLSKYTAKLAAEYERQFEVQCEMFEQLGVPDPRMRSLHFSSLLQGIMLMFSNYPKGFPLAEVKKQVLQEINSLISRHECAKS